MKQAVLQIFTRTPMHIGAGASVGDIDQPHVRERHTGFLVIPGSGSKGALVDHFLARNDDATLKIDRQISERTEDGRFVFGDELDEAQARGKGRSHTGRGGVSFVEGRLLAFPVRSGKGCFAWITCPFVLSRWSRDTGAALGTLPNDLPPDEVCAGADLAAGGEVLFEDYVLACRKEADGSPSVLDDTTVGSLADAHDDPVWADLCRSRLALVHDEIFALLVRTTCEVPQHVSIDDETGAAAEGKLFNQESCPAETLFYSLLEEVRPDALDKLKGKANEFRVLQLGADATTGLGFCTTRIVDIPPPSPGDPPNRDSGEMDSSPAAGAETGNPKK